MKNHQKQILKPNDTIREGDQYLEDGKWHDVVAEDFEILVSDSGYDSVRRTSSVLPSWEQELRFALDAARIELKKRSAVEQFISDAAAFLRYNAEHETWNESVVLSTLVHDIMGLANNERCFEPRVSGYSKMVTK